MGSTKKCEVFQSPCNLSKSIPPIRPNGIKTQKTAAVPKISEAILKN